MKMKFIVPLALGLLMIGSLAVPVAGIDDQATVAVSFDFGNGIVAWADITITPGMTALNATETACAELDYTLTAPGGFVSEINGYASSWPNEWWGLFVWNTTTDSWDMASTGAADLNASDFTAINWNYAVDWPQVPSLATPDHRYPWASARHDALNSGASDFVPNNITSRWTKDVGNGAINAPVAVTGGFEYVITGGLLNMTTFAYETNSSVYCLDSDGNAVWNRDIGIGYQVGGPLVYNGMVIVPSANGKIYAFNCTDGLPLWTFDTGSEGEYGVTSSPIAYRGDIIAAASNGFVFRLHDNGTLVWNRSIATTIYASSPAIMNGTIYIGADDGKLHALAENGTTEEFSVQIGGRIRGSPLLLPDRIIITYVNLTGSSPVSGGIAAVDYDGNLIWQMTTNVTSASPCLTASGIASVNPTGLCSVDANGQLQWTVPLGTSFAGGAPTSAGDVVFLVTDEAESRMMAIGPNGQIYVETSLLPANYAWSAPVISDGVMYVTGDNGYVYAFNLNSVAPTATLNVTTTDMVGHFQASTPIGTFVGYEWDFGDGNKSTAAMVDHAYTKAGTYTVNLTVSSPDGQSHVYTTSVQASEPAPGDDLLVFVVVGIVAVVAIGVVGALLMARRK
jgi:outer membrane protein assembly factor BamB